MNQSFIHNHLNNNEFALKTASYSVATTAAAARYCYSNTRILPMLAHCNAITVCYFIVLRPKVCKFIRRTFAASFNITMCIHLGIHSILMSWWIFYRWILWKLMKFWEAHLHERSNWPVIISLSNFYFGQKYRLELSYWWTTYIRAARNEAAILYFKLINTNCVLISVLHINKTEHFRIYFTWLSDLFRHCENAFWLWCCFVCIVYNKASKIPMASLCHVIEPAGP